MFNFRNMFFVFSLGFPHGCSLCCYFSWVLFGDVNGSVMVPSNTSKRSQIPVIASHGKCIHPTHPIHPPIHWLYIHMAISIECKVWPGQFLPETPEKRNIFQGGGNTLIWNTTPTKNWNLGNFFVFFRTGYSLNWGPRFVGKVSPVFPILKPILPVG